MILRVFLVIFVHGASRETVYQFILFKTRCSSEKLERVAFGEGDTPRYLHLRARTQAGRSFVCLYVSRPVLRDCLFWPGPDLT